MSVNPSQSLVPISVETVVSVLPIIFSESDNKITRAKEQAIQLAMSTESVRDRWYDRKRWVTREEAIDIVERTSWEWTYKSWMFAGDDVFNWAVQLEAACNVATGGVLYFTFGEAHAIQSYVEMANKNKVEKQGTAAPLTPAT